MPRHRPRNASDDFAKLKIKREKTRLALDQAKLETIQNPAALYDDAAFKAHAATKTATEMHDYLPPQTDEECIEMAQRLAPITKTWVREYGEFLLLIYDQNLAKGQTEHLDALTEWADAMHCVAYLGRVLEERDLPATSRFDYNPDLGGQFPDRQKEVMAQRETFLAQTDEL